MRSIAGILAVLVISCISFASLTRALDHKVASCHEQKDENKNDKQQMDCCQESVPASTSFTVDTPLAFVALAIQAFDIHEAHGFGVAGPGSESPPKIVSSSTILRL